MCNIILVILCIAIVIICTLAVIVAVSNIKHKKRLEGLTRYQINTSATIDSSIPEILDLIIKESFTDYQIKSLIPLQEGFLNNEREDKIRRDLIDIVSSRISNAALDKVSLFYNTKNISSILADKIYIHVMNYVVEHNKAIDQE